MYPSRYLLRSARLLTLSAARAGPAAAAVARPAVAAFARPAAMQPFSSSNRQLEGTRFRGGPLWERGDVVEYEELKPLTESPDDSVLLVDVREPNEVALGSIPSSVNVPLSEFEKAISLDEGDFTRIYGFHKPDKKQPIIFYCRAGIRAGTAVDLAKRAGYKNLRNYEGSYLDWLEQEAHSGANQDD